MARGNQTFKAAFLLDAKQFKAGVREIQGSLKSLKGSFMDFSSAIGVGLGMVSFISNLKDTAVKLSVAQNTLKNVSYETLKYKNATYEAEITLDKYKENLKFVEGLSNKYGQSIIALTHEFAQFTAAANGLGISLDEQKRIYEALVRASATFHMSEDKTRDMIVAVTQMMSKGKITAEELRRQLGNHLPGAFNLMAKAAGVSTAKLEDMMKKGDALAVDLLPKFATELNNLTKDAHFDSLQTSLNRFGNAWVSFTQSTGFEGIFTKLVNAGISALDTLTKHFNAFVWAAAGAFGTKLVMGMTRGYNTLTQKGEDWFNAQQSQLKRTETQIDKLQEKLISTGEFLKTRRDSNYRFAPKASTFDKDLIKDLVEYNNLLIKQKQIRLEIDTLTTKEYKKLQTQIASLQQQNNKLIQTYQLSQNVGSSFSTWQKFLKGVKIAIDGIKGALFSMGITAIVSALVGLMAKVVGNIKEWRKELERIKNIYSDYEAELKKSTSSVTAQEKQLYSLLKVIKDVKSTEDQRKTALNEIKKITGSDIEIKKLEKIEDAYDRIKQAVADWIKLEKIKASISLLSQKNAEAEARNEEIATERLSLVRRKLQEEEVANSPTANWFVRKDAEIRIARLTKRINALNNETKANNKIIEDSDAKMQEFHKQMSEVLDAENNDYGDGNGNKKGIAKIYEDYTKDKKELANKLKEHALTEEEYNKELDKLNKAFWLNAAATGELRIEEIIKKQDAGRALTAIEKWYVALRDGAIKAAQNAIMDGIAESVVADVDKYLEDELKEAEKELKKLIEGDEKRFNIDVEYAGKRQELALDRKNNKRDSTFDYKKTKSDILSEQLDITEDNLSKIDDCIKDLMEKEQELMAQTGQGLDDIAKNQLEGLREDYRLLSKEANTLEEAFKFNKISEDIEELEKNMTGTIIDGIGDFADSMDNIVQGAKNLREIMENVDSTGWEKLMGVINYIFNIIDAVTGVIETVNTLTEISNTLAGARAALDGKKNADAAIELESTVAQVAAEEALSAVKAKEAAFETTITTNKVAQAEAALGVATALGVETAAWLALAAAQKDAAMAAAAAQAAMAGGPAAPAAALAAAASVGAGLTATMAAFAKGGIVGGNSTSGDHNIIRANSGEMILNKAQQGTLFNMLNGKGGMGGNVEFKIRGADLVGTINNYTSRKRG